MKTVQNLLDHKGTDVWTIAPTSTVFDAVRLMADKQIGALVVKEGERVVGLLSERDYARKITLQERSSKDTKIEEIMSRKIICVTPERSIEDCMALMSEKRIRHLPVVVDKGLVGLISIGDVVRCVIEDQVFHIQQLENYITGG